MCVKPIKLYRYLRIYIYLNVTDNQYTYYRKIQFWRQDFLTVSLIQRCRQKVHVDDLNENTCECEAFGNEQRFMTPVSSRCFLKKIRDYKTEILLATLARFNKKKYHEWQGYRWTLRLYCSKHWHWLRFAWKTSMKVTGRSKRQKITLEVKLPNEIAEMRTAEKAIAFPPKQSKQSKNTQLKRVTCFSVCKSCSFLLNGLSNRILWKIVYIVLNNSYL